MNRTEAIEQSRDPMAMTEENWRKVVAGEKWQTRRGMNPQPLEDMHADCIRCDFYNPVKVDKHGEEYPGKEVYGAYDTFGEWGVASKYQPGEIYYLPEPVRIMEFWQHAGSCTVKYLWTGTFTKRWITDEETDKIIARKRGWDAPTTARFMLKSFAREFVRIKSVRVERLQDISFEDAIAEGVEQTGNWPDPEDEFRELWNSIHGADAWDENPWVWVYEFERLEVKP